jgi:hypothetical protein
MAASFLAKSEPPSNVRTKNIKAMNNINSQKEFFEGKKTFDYTVHHRLPRIKLNNTRRRRKTAYKGIFNNGNNEQATTSRRD